MEYNDLIQWFLFVSLQGVRGHEGLEEGVEVAGSFDVRIMVLSVPR